MLSLYVRAFAFRPDLSTFHLPCSYLSSGFLLNGMRRPFFLLSQYFLSPMLRFNLLLALVPGPRKGVQVCLRISNQITKASRS